MNALYIGVANALYIGVALILALLLIVNRKLDRILAQSGASRRQEWDMTVNIQQIKDKAEAALAAIQAESVKDDAIIALVQHNTQQISDLKQQLADAIDNGASQADLQAVLDSLTAAETSALANGQKVVDAVNANTGQ